MSDPIKIDGSIPKTLVRAVIKLGEKIREANDERGTGDGYWAYTRPGWCWDDPGLHTIHEYTVRGMISAFGRIMPCDCNQCKIDKAAK
jgi:hypothetical protein